MTSVSIDDVIQSVESLKNLRVADETEIEE